jgi:hypothetical protein
MVWPCHAHDRCFFLYIGVCTFDSKTTHFLDVHTLHCEWSHPRELIVLAGHDCYFPIVHVKHSLN